MPSKQNEEKTRLFYTVAELSKQWRVTKKTVLNWIYAGKLQAHQMIGGTYRISLEEAGRISASLGIKPPIGPTILIIDDKAEAVQSLATYLAILYPQSIVHSATSGLQGLYLLGKTNADLLILDIKIPDLDGLRIIKEVRRAKKKIKILVLSGFLDESVIDDLAWQGVTEYLHKPVDILLLKQKINLLLTEKPLSKRGLRPIQPKGASDNSLQQCDKELS